MATSAAPAKTEISEAPKGISPSSAPSSAPDSAEKPEGTQAAEEKAATSVESGGLKST